MLQKIRAARLTLNKDKCIFNVNEVKFLEHILSSEGLKIDPDKVKAIQMLERLKDKKQLQRILGMVNYVGKFINNLSNLTEPLRRLLISSEKRSWGDEQTEALNRIKRVLMSPPVLRYFDVNEKIKLSVDASSMAIGVTLLQQNQPVAYATKAFTPAQRLFPQIEKEALAVKFGCKKFHQFICGQDIEIETDHKPLESISRKPLHTTPAGL